MVIRIIMRRRCRDLSSSEVGRINSYIYQSTYRICIPIVTYRHSMRIAGTKKKKMLLNSSKGDDAISVQKAESNEMLPESVKEMNNKKNDKLRTE